jgi:hypothetical protein
MKWEVFMQRTKQVMEQRRKDAEARNEIYSKLTLEQKLSRNSPNGKVAKKLLKAAAKAAKAVAATK